MHAVDAHRSAPTARLSADGACGAPALGGEVDRGRGWGRGRAVVVLPGAVNKGVWCLGLEIQRRGEAERDVLDEGRV